MAETTFRAPGSLERTRGRRAPGRRTDRGGRALGGQWGGRSRIPVTATFDGVPPTVARSSA